MVETNSEMSNGELPVSELKILREVVSGERIVVHLETISKTKVKNEALLKFQFKNASSEVIPMEDWKPRSAVVGDYRYITSKEKDGSCYTSVSLVAPEGAETLEITGVQWKKGTSTFVISEAVVWQDSEPIQQFSMRSGRPLEYPSSLFVKSFDLQGLGSKAVVRIAYKMGQQTKNAPIQVVFKDENGSALLPYTDLPQNPKFGAFINLDASERSLGTKDVTLDFPNGASTLELHGIDWGAKSATLVGPIELLPMETVSIESFLKELPAETPLLIIDTTAPPLGHETLSLRPNNLTAAYERLGVAVIFFPFSSIQEFPSSVSALVTQFNRGDFDHVIQKCIESRDPLNSVYISSSFPSIQSITAAQLFKRSGWKVIYEVRDDMEEFNRVGYSKWYDVQLERQMLRVADLVVSVSEALDQKLKSITLEMPPHYVIPNAVNLTVVNRGENLRSNAAMESRKNSKIIGYVGHLTDSWFDWPLVLAGAELLPSYKFEIVGHGMPDGIVLPSNVKYLGPKSHDELPEIVKRWKVGMIPFADLPLTRSVDPNKIYEYFAWGLRCVSAPMGMVKQYPSTWVYRGVDEFVTAAHEAIETEYSSTEIQELNDFVREATWDSRAVEMLDLIGIPYKEVKNNA